MTICLSLQWIRRQRGISLSRLSKRSKQDCAPRRRPLIESLESRQLLSVTINEFPIPTNGADPVDIVSGPDGNLWFTEVAGKIGQINPTTHAIAEFPVPTAGAEAADIAAGPDGNLWFTEFSPDFKISQIGVINPKTHLIAEFPVPTASSQPLGITAGPDGNLWFTEAAISQIGVISPTTHVITEFSIPNSPRGGSGPSGITTGPDGNLWFTEIDNNIGQINPTTHVINQFPLPSAAGFRRSIVTGPDGNLWFTEESTNNIGQINPTTHEITEFPVPTANSRPFGIAVGPDGNLWFTENAVAQIGTIKVTSHAIIEFPTPRPRSFPTGITTGPDHNLWFLEQAGGVAQAVLGTPATAPDLALSGTAPDSVGLGTSLTYTLTVTNGGTAGATGVTLTDALPAGVTFVSATDGTAPKGGLLTFLIGDLAAGGSATISITVTPATSGSLLNQASVNMTANDPTPADDSLSQRTSVTSTAAGDGPTVTLVQRFGIHTQPTTLVLTFDEPLDPGRAQDVHNYQIVELGRGSRTIRFKSAVYDAGSQTVTLSPVRRLNFHHRFRLVVLGAGPGGLTDTLGRRLDGGNNGGPGSNFVTFVTARNLVVPGADPGRPRSARTEPRVRGGEAAG
jgi:virginiamycin B lyase